MQVSNLNNVKIYNLSAGKSLPEWLSDKKKRRLKKNNIDIRRRIELIQDFDMPAVSNCVKMSRDGKYVITTGIYKPRVKCYDVYNLSMKFERCFDSEVIKFEVLSDDYSKMIFLQCDRYVEFHAKYGRYHRIRIPKFGRDMSYHFPSCDLYIVGSGSEVYRLNMEQGRFLQSLSTDASSINTCDINPVHQLFACGTSEGRVECWDPRSRQRVGNLDCALSSVTQDTNVEGLPGITSVKFNNNLQMGVGTTTGQVLVYDIRSNKPMLVKDHMYGLPITNIEFIQSQNLVLSMDSKIIKIWDQSSGKPYTSIEPPDTSLNDVCLIQDTGLLFVANEDKKILTYYIPSIGPAPKWCSFLDNLTEELEESNEMAVYDDYKFVTHKEIEELGLAHLLGTNLLRAYMHGYFMDIRLYRKAKAIAEPFAFHDYKMKKIREKIESERSNRVQIHKLPKVNRELAQKLLDNQNAANKKVQKSAAILEDNRFQALFDNPDFQVDEESEEFRLLNPVVSKLDKSRKKEIRKQQELMEQFDEVKEPDDENSDSSSDDEHTWTAEVKKQHKMLSNEARMKRRQEDAEAKLKPKFYELKTTDDFHVQAANTLKSASSKNLSLGERVMDDEGQGKIFQTSGSGGNQSMTFQLKKNVISQRDQKEELKHHDERKKLRRSAHSISKRGGKQKGNG